MVVVVVVVGLFDEWMEGSGWVFVRWWCRVISELKMMLVVCSSGRS